MLPETVDVVVAPAPAPPRPKATEATRFWMSAEAVLVAVMDTSPAGADSDAFCAAASTVVPSVVVTIETPIAMAASLTATLTE